MLLAIWPQIRFLSLKYHVLQYLEGTEDACMQIWPRAQTVLGLGAYGPQKYFNFFLPFTVSYGLPEPSPSRRSRQVS